MQRGLSFAGPLAALILTTPVSAEEKEVFRPGERVVFLGDSITAAGGYIVDLEVTLRRLHPKWKIDLINLGLPSETACGLSEPDHPFPRPDVHERLDRVLERAKPRLVIACYGMNDGIYYPFSDERFATYQRGIRRLIEKVRAAGARLLLLTPPPFDPLPMKKKGKLRPRGAEKFAWFAIYEDYDKDVLARYAEWILEKTDGVERAVDVRSKILRYLRERRRTEPDFVMSGDGVHIDRTGHRLIHDAIAEAAGLEVGGPEAGGLGVQAATKSLRALVEKRQAVLHAAWLSHVGHKRPGAKPGLPLEEANAAAAAIDAQIAKLAADP